MTDERKSIPPSVAMWLKLGGIAIAAALGGGSLSGYLTAREVADAVFRVGELERRFDRHGEGAHPAAQISINELNGRVTDYRARSEEWERANTERFEEIRRRLTSIEVGVSRH